MESYTNTHNKEYISNANEHKTCTILSMKLMNPLHPYITNIGLYLIPLSSFPPFFLLHLYSLLPPSSFILPHSFLEVRLRHSPLQPVPLTDRPRDRDGAQRNAVGADWDDSLGCLRRCAKRHTLRHRRGQPYVVHRQYPRPRLTESVDRGQRVC